CGRREDIARATGDERGDTVVPLSPRDRRASDGHDRDPRPRPRVPRRGQRRVDERDPAHGDRVAGTRRTSSPSPRGGEAHQAPLVGRLRDLRGKVLPDEGGEALRQAPSTDAAEHVEKIRPYLEWGFTHLVFHFPGQDQERALRIYAKEVLPRLRA